MITLLIILIFIQLFNTKLLFKLKNQNKMNQEELATALETVNTQIQKGIAEVIAAVAASGNTTPRVDAALTALQTAAQALDDINPDAPTP